VTPTPNVIEFAPFPKISRLSREIVITEKLDGTNAQIIITEDGQIAAASRKCLVVPGKRDNYGFAGWVQEHAADLMKLGPGRHFGEWWGKGIQRAYGQTEKRFSLFNVALWSDEESRPKCCGVVPVLCRGPFTTGGIDAALEALRINGSFAAPGFMEPEGIVIFHTASRTLFKKTLDRDEEWKGKAA
jgi:RNA ligase